MEDTTRLPTTLLELLRNDIVLRHTAPYIPVRELRRLAATCRSLRDLLYSQPDAWRYLNLKGVQRAIIETSPIDVGGMSWRAQRMDESLTEDDFYGGPLRGILGSLHSRHILKFVQTLVLDGLAVPADVVREIVAEDRYNVRILSLRGSRQLNHTKLMQVLRYIVRPTREDSTPKLKALYYFGPMELPVSTSPPQTQQETPSLGVMGSPGAQIGAKWNAMSSYDLLSRISDGERKWYHCNGKVIKKPRSEWAEVLQVCKGIINFDAVLCRGPRHDITKVDSKDFLQPAIATVALGGSGCESCHSCPEQPAVFGQSSSDQLPLLAPVPSHASTVRAATRPEQKEDDGFPRLILRCEDCLRGRWCEQCNRWWCENCYQDTVIRLKQRTEPQQLELGEELQQNGWATVTHVPATGQVKVFSKLCVEHCLVEEMMSGAGSNGMWG